MNFRSLTITLAAAFLVLSSVVLLTSSGLNIYGNFQNQRQAIIEQQQFIANDAAGTVKDFIQSKLSLLSAAANLGNLSAGSLEKQKLVLDRLLGLEPAFRQLLLLDAQGKELLRVSRLSLLASDQLEQYRKDKLIFKDNSQDMYVGSVYIDEITSEPMVIMRIQVIDIFGDSKGSLMAEVNLKFMWDLVGSIKVGRQGLVYVVDRKGNLIAFNDISRVLKGENLSQLSAVRKFLGGQNKIVAQVFRGIHNSYVLSTFVSLGMPNWAVVVELPVLEGYSTVIESLKVSLLIIFLSFILAIVVGILLSKIITKPIIKLRDATKLISKGNLDVKIEVQSKDEIGELATSFNQMTRDLQNTTTSIDNLNHEVDARKRSEKLLQESKQQLLDIINFLPDATFVIDAQGMVIAWNKACEELTGVKAADMLGKGNYEYALPFYGERRPIIIDLTSKPLEGVASRYPSIIEHDGSNLTAESFVPRLFGGKGAYLSIKAHFLFDGSGKTIGGIETVRDITASKKAEAELKNAYEQLKFTQAQLVQSEKLEAVGRIASGVAHEVKNPLGIVLQSVNYLEDNFPAGQKNVPEVLLVMKENIKRADRIIRGLVDFSRMAEINIQPDDINTVLDNALVLVHHSVVKDAVQIVKELSEGLPKVLVDKGKIEQVFINILLNAIQAMSKGGKLIVRTYLAPLDRQGKNIGKRSMDFFNPQEKVVFVEIEDSGAGIPAENISKVFDPFFTTKEPGSGTGLGLSVCKNIVDLHKALIDIQSQVGKGTKVTVILKIA